MEEIHPYKPLHIGRASELTGRDKVLYRLFEMIPGLLAWSTIIGAIVFSYFTPKLMAFFIIAFDLYWLLKTIFLSIHLRQNWRRMKHNINLDWAGMLQTLKYEHVLHLVILPFYKEGEDVVGKSIQALADSEYDNKKFIVVLASEERAGEDAQQTAHLMKDRYGNVFGDFIITTHPADVPGEMAGKGSNIAYAIEEVRKEVLDAKNINYKVQFLFYIIMNN